MQKMPASINVSHYTGSVINTYSVMWKNFIFFHQHTKWLLKEEVQW